MFHLLNLDKLRFPLFSHYKLLVCTMGAKFCFNSGSLIYIIEHTWVLGDFGE